MDTQPSNLGTITLNEAQKMMRKNDLKKSSIALGLLAPSALGLIGNSYVSLAIDWAMRKSLTGFEPETLERYVSSAQNGAIALFVLGAAAGLYLAHSTVTNSTAFRQNPREYMRENLNLSIR